MFRRAKEEDKIEMIIRGLMKEPENKRCMNCNSLGPQYVCTTFWTFVCTNCSGVHRSFTHRVKSVSMARFSEDEIMALQAGGNERARQIYFKDWDPQRNQYPNSSNLHRLKEFVKNVYVDRKYAGSNNSYKRSSLGSTEDFSEKPSFERGCISSKDEFSDRCPIERTSPSTSGKERSFRDIFEARSPREMQENSRSSRQRNKVAQFEIVDDRFRDDGKVKRYERHSRKDSRTGSMSPSSGRSSSLPAIRPVKDFLSEKVNLAVAANHKDIDGKEVEASNEDQKAAASSGNVEALAAESRANGVKQPVSTPKGLKAADPTVSKLASEIQTQAEPVNSRSSCGTEAKSVPQTDEIPHKMTSLESLLYELSVPMTSTSSGGGGELILSTSPKPIDNVTTGPPEVSSSVEALPVTMNTGDPMLQEAQVYQLPPGQQNDDTLVSPPKSDIKTSSNAALSNHENQIAISKDPTPAQSILPIVPKDLTSSQSIVPVVQTSKAPYSGDESKSCTRRELPEDLFTSSFGSFTPGVAAWQMHTPHGTGYPLQFQSPSTSAAGFMHQMARRNPFEISDEPFQVHASGFPSIQKFQSLPNGSTSPAFGSQPLTYASPVPSYQMNMHLVPLEHLANGMHLTRPQGVPNPGNYNAFASLNSIQQPKGGNPFG